MRSPGLSRSDRLSSAARLRLQLDFCPLPLAAVDVHVNRCLDNMVAGGVQISGLHATVAPRRQQLQSPPTLEEFVFVPHVDTQCLRSNGKLAEQLRLCRGTLHHTP